MTDELNPLQKRQRSEDTPEFQRRVSAASLSVIINPDPPDSLAPSFIPSPQFQPHQGTPLVDTRPPPSLSRMEQNVFGARPAEDIVRVVADFMYTHLKDRTNVE
ncbi:hypothetical protein GGI21_005525, partial [Coemansia aciculifera]